MQPDLQPWHARTSMRIVMEALVLKTDEEARREGFIPVVEAAKLFGGHRTTYYRQVKMHKKPGCLVKNGSVNDYWILLASLRPIDDVKTSKYTEVLDQWCREMEAGTHREEGKPASSRYINLLKGALKRYWAILEIEESFDALNVTNLKKVLLSDAFKVDEEREIDHHSGKTQIYQAVTYFTAYLVREGIKSRDDLEPLRKQKPKKRFHLRKEVLEDWEIEQALEFNRVWRSGRSAGDVCAMEVIIAVFCYAGIRASEAIKIRLEHVSLKKKRLHVRGKGGKHRFVPIHPKLYPILEAWLKNNRPDSTLDYLLIQSRADRPLTLSCIGQRFRRMRKALNSNMHAHALRRTFATILSNSGVPLELLQGMLGHSDIKTTMGYVMSKEKDAQKYMEALYGYDPGIEPKQKAPDATAVIILNKPISDFSDDELLERLRRA